MALTFNGSTSNYAQKAITFSAGKGTIMAWCRVATDRNDYSTFFQLNNTDNQQFVLQTGADGTTLSSYIYDNTVTGASLTVGTWYHLAMTWDGTSARVYVNGTLNITNTATGSTWSEVRLGTSYWGEPLNGNIAHVKAWDAVLNSTEIAAEKPSITAVRTTNLKGEWQTPEGASRLSDTSGNSNNLTLFGTLTDYANPLREAAAAIALGAMSVSGDGTVTGGTSDINGAAAITLGAMTAAGTVGGVSYIGSATSFSGSGVTSRTCNVPSGTADGDLMLAVVMVELASASVTAHANWGTAILNTPLSTRTHTQVVYARIASSEPASYTFSWSSAECGVAIVTYRNAALPTLYNSQVNNSTTASCTAPTLTASIASMWSVWIGTIMYGTTWTPPTNYNERVDQRTSTASTNMAMGIADYLLTAAGATDTVVGTAANADYNVGSQILLAPYAGPVGDAAITLGGVGLSAAGTVAAASISGDASITFGALTTTAAGTVAVSGAGANTLSSATLASAGTVAVTGAGSSSLGAVTVSAAGTVAVTGAATNTLAAPSITAAGTVAIAGAAGTTLAAPSITAAGTVAVAGDATNTLAALTVDAAGTVATVSGSGAADIALAALTSGGTGTVAVMGTADITFGAVTSSAASTVDVAGVSAVTLAALTSGAAGVVAVTGAANTTLGAVTSSAAGVVDVTGAANTTLAALTVTAGGTLAVTGAAAVTLGAVTLEGAGVAAVAGDGTVTPAAVTVDAAGAVIVAGSVDVVLAALTIDGAALLSIVGTATTTLAPAAADGAGVVAVTGTATVTLGAVTVDAAGMIEEAQAIHGDATIALGVLSLSAAGVVAFVAIVNRVRGPGLRGGTVAGSGGGGAVVGPARSGSVTGSSGAGTVRGPRAAE